MSEVLSVRIDDETKQRLDQLSELTHRPASVYVREALQTTLEDLEDYYLGMQALEEHRKNPVTYTLEEAEQILGLDS